MTRKTYCVAVLSFDDMCRLLWSTAHAVAVNYYTNVQWEEYNDSRVINAIYAILPRKGKPGLAVVEQNWDKIFARQQTLYGRYLEALCRHAAAGPKDLVAFLKRMELLRQSARHDVDAAFREAMQINSGVTALAGEAVRNLAKIQLGASLVVFALSGGAAIGVVGAGAAGGMAVGSAVAASSAGAAGTTALAYELSLTVAKNWDEAEAAAAIAIDGLKELAEEGTEKALGAAIGVVGKVKTAQGALGLFNNSAAYVEAQKKMQQLTEKLARDLGERRRRRYQRRLAEVAKEVAEREARLLQAAKQIRLGTAAGAVAQKGIPLIFMVGDMMDAIGDYQSVVAATR